MLNSTIPEIEHIKKALCLIAPYIHKTPVLSSQLLNNILGCSLELKCENFQKAGAFKYRGASHAILCLSAAEKCKGVATHSSGNHAAALAKAAQLNGIKAYIVMPKNAPQTKIEAVVFYGGIITFCEPTLEARESTLQHLISQTGATFIHPYDSFNVICGQGTACLELSEQIIEPDIIVAPVGGGGLLSGTSVVAKNIWQNTLVIGAEPGLANDAFLSLKSGILQAPTNANTIADGLKTALSDLTFEIIKNNVDEIVTVSEEGIIKALKLVCKYLKIVIEPSSAVVVGAILEHPEHFKNKKVATIVSGGNYEPEFNLL